MECNVPQLQQQLAAKILTDLLPPDVVESIYRTNSPEDIQALRLGDVLSLVTPSSLCPLDQYRPRYRDAD